MIKVKGLQHVRGVLKGTGLIRIEKRPLPSLGDIERLAGNLASLSELGSPITPSKEMNALIAIRNQAKNLMNCANENRIEGKVSRLRGSLAEYENLFGTHRVWLSSGVQALCDKGYGLSLSRLDEKIGEFRSLEFKQRDQLPRALIRLISEWSVKQFGVSIRLLNREETGYGIFVEALFSHLGLIGESRPFKNPEMLYKYRNI